MRGTLRIGGPHTSRAHLPEVRKRRNFVLTSRARLWQRILRFLFARGEHTDIKCDQCGLLRPFLHFSTSFFSFFNPFCALFFPSPSLFSQSPSSAFSRKWSFCLFCRATNRREMAATSWISWHPNQWSGANLKAVTTGGSPVWMSVIDL